MTEFKAQGKLLITGEYLILHGTKSLALPLLKFTQILRVEKSQEKLISWAAYDQNNQLWFSAQLSTELKLLSTCDEKRGEKLRSILLGISRGKKEFFTDGASFETKMNFSPDWGFGSSSTLISLLSQWSGLDPYDLQTEHFGGSGYDIACATSESPLLFELNNKKPTVTKIQWSPAFKDQLYFLYLGKKQDSREALSGFKNQTPIVSTSDIEVGTEFTKKFLEAGNLNEFQLLMKEHEQHLSRLLNRECVKLALFPDFPGEIKSLGGWGGDFVLVACAADPRAYFEKRGLNLILKWDDLV